MTPPRPTTSTTDSTSPGRTPLRRPGELSTSMNPSPPTTGSQNGTAQTPLPADTRTPSEVYPLSFATESLELSQVLKTALDHNLDLRSAAFDVAISEKNIMVALGAYDVFMTSSLYVARPRPRSAARRSPSTSASEADRRQHRLRAQARDRRHDQPASAPRAA
jgi:hypothetical protein